MKSIEDWRSRHPQYNNRVALESLRARYPERQIWVGDEQEQLLAEPVTTDDFFQSLLAAGQDAFRNRPILPSSVLLGASKDITVYALGRSLKDPEDAAEVLIKRSLRPHAVRFLEGMFELVEEAHDSGTRTDALTAHIDARLPHILQLAVKISNQVDDGVPTAQFCTMIWEEAT